MFDTWTPVRESPATLNPAAVARSTTAPAGTPTVWRARGYLGPERRTATTHAQWLAAMLDEIDYALLLVDAQSRCLHLNRAARDEIERDSAHPLLLRGRELHTRRAADAGALRAAIADATGAGRRRLLALGDDADDADDAGDESAAGPHAAASRVTLAIVPIGPGTAQIVLGKRRLSQPISVDAFARQHALTAAESRVLAGLCEGRTPRAVAEAHGVGLATVRSQIGSIRAKTGAGSIRELVRQVAVLPPLVNALRC